MVDRDALYSQKTDRLIATSADKALGKLEQATPVDRQQAEAMRERLYSWLMRVNDLTNKPSLAVGAEVAALLDEEFQTGLNALHTPEALAVLDAWATLPDDVALKLIGQMVGRLFANSVQGLLLSRQHPSRAWAATGFHLDRPLRTVLAKVGDLQPEPIGFDDDKHYVPTAGSKALWMREWAMAVLLPFGPAFQVNVDDTPQEVGDAVALSDRERARMLDMANQMDDDIRVWKQLAAEAQGIIGLPTSQQPAAAQMNKANRDEHQAKMQLSVDLACTRVSRLERYLDSYETLHPEVGKRFQNVPLEDRVRLIGSFLRAKLDDDDMRRVIEGPALSVPVDDVPSTIVQLYTRLKALLDVPENKQDGDEMNSVLSGARAAVPELHHALTEYEAANPEVTADVGAKWVLAWLASRLKPS